MSTVTLRRDLSSSVIFGDFHLSAHRSLDDEALGQWVGAILEARNPRLVILAGDTFELSFLQGKIRGCSMEEKVQAIYKIHEDVFLRLVRHPSVKEIVFLPGDHDHVISTIEPDIIQRLFAPKKVIISESVYDERIGLLAIHGHQLDYNRTAEKVGGLALTDRLTDVFEDYVLGDAVEEPDILAACDAGKFSFWYASGCLPKFLKATEGAFDYDANEYFEALRKLLGSEYFDDWRRQIKNRFNRWVASVARAISWLPSGVLRAVHRAWGWLCGFTFYRRARNIVRGKRDSTIIDLTGVGDVSRLVVSHAHDAREVRVNVLGERRCVNVAISPRWHLRGLWNGQLHLERDCGVVVIDERGEAFYHSSDEQQSIPVEQGFAAGNALELPGSFFIEKKVGVI